MTRYERVRYEMLLRARDFGAAHRALFPESSASGQAFATVAQAAAEIDAHNTTKAFKAKDGREGMTVARALVMDRMQTIARTARGMQKAPGAASRKLRMTGRMSDVALLAMARAFLSEAEAKWDTLAHLGLQATCLSRLREAVDALDRALAERRAGRAGVFEAQAGIEAGIESGTDAVRTLDIVLANALEDNAVLFATWKRVRRVVDAKTKAGSPAPDPEDVTTTDPLPAAPAAALADAPASLAKTDTPTASDSLRKAS